MPRKFDGNHRGFAFVEFLTKQEALSAYKALADTHLYGRHLVLEWANKDEGLEEMVGMRMGHGVREGEQSTRLWYVTTGYLVQLMSAFPDQFAKHSHLVIDEVIDGLMA